MAEELAGQADQLQSTMSFFKVKNEQRRLITDSGNRNGGGQASRQTQTAGGTGSQQQTAVKAGPAAKPAAAASKSEATGITIPMGDSNGASADLQDDEFEEY